MRNFIISLICLAAVMCSWIIFSFYSEAACNEIRNQTEQLVTQSIVTGDWTSAEKDYGDLMHMWNQYKQVASIFLDSKDVNEIDCTMDKAYFYMKAKDISNSSGEFFYLKDKICLLKENDAITLSNIF